MNNEQQPTKEIREGVGYLLGIILFGFLYGFGSLVLLGMLLQWTLGIDITEFDKTYRLILIVWAGWVIGLHLYYKKQEEELIQEMLDELRRKGSVVVPPRLQERFNKAQKDDENFKKYIEKRREMESDPRSNDPFYLSDKHRALKEEIVTSSKKNENKTN